MANCVVRYPLYFETLINKIKLNLYIPFSAQKSEVWSESAIYPTTFSCSAVSCSGGSPPPVFFDSRRLRDAVFFILLK